MNEVTEYQLPPTDDEFTLSTRTACTGAGHLPNCYNPWIDETFCRCGAQRGKGHQIPASPPIPLCDAFKAMTMQSYCGSCYHNRDEHAGIQPAPVEAQFALFPAA